MVSLSALAENWSSLYSNSSALRSSLNFAHIGALLGSGGCAIATDRAVLMASHADRVHRMKLVQSLDGVHRIVIAGLAIVGVSGLLLLFADLDALLHSTAFWLKMAAVVALAINGGILFVAGRRAGAGHEAAWRGLRRASVASLVLWFTTTLLGAVLPNVV